MLTEKCRDRKDAWIENYKGKSEGGKSGENLENEGKKRKQRGR